MTFDLFRGLDLVFFVILQFPCCCFSFLRSVALQYRISCPFSLSRTVVFHLWFSGNRREKSYPTCHEPTSTTLNTHRDPQGARMNEISIWINVHHLSALPDLDFLYHDRWGCRTSESMGMVNQTDTIHLPLSTTTTTTTTRPPPVPPTATLFSTGNLSPPPPQILSPHAPLSGGAISNPGWMKSTPSRSVTSCNGSPLASRFLTPLQTLAPASRLTTLVTASSLFLRPHMQLASSPRSPVPKVQSRLCPTLQSLLS